MSQTVGCYRWKRDGLRDTFWSAYPAASEEHDGHEATILYWEVEE
jgi:hypothetical protein